MDLKVSDILIFKDLEPLRLKIWEIVRCYNPMYMAAFLYLLDNISLNSKKIPIGK
ncbi:GbNV_gp48-like [Fopius arisanus]|nr:GbNV_gp48-like [Fopius arisanus]